MSCCFYDDRCLCRKYRRWYESQPIPVIREISSAGIKFLSVSEEYKKIKMDGKTVDEEAIRGINVYFTAYMLLVILSTFLVCIDGTDLVSGFSSVLGTFNNIGPGLAKYGPACNFGVASTFSKCVYIFDMLAGRLEIFPVLILLYPPSWRGLLKRRIKRKKNSRTNISVS